MDASKTKLNTVENKTNCFIGVKPTDFYFSVWCYEAGITPGDSWKIHNTTEVLSTEEAAIMFVEEFDREHDRFFAKNYSKIEDMVIWVQDWRGRIAKFKIVVKNQLMYYARRIN